MVPHSVIRIFVTFLLILSHALLAAQVITFPPFPIVTLGAKGFSPGASASSGLVVSYASSNPSVATVSAQGIVDVRRAGATVITASQAGDGTTPAAVPVARTLWVKGPPASVLRTWGYNDSGQIGDGTKNVDRSTPYAVPGLDSIMAVSAGCYFTLALKADGTVMAWGLNDSGVLGDGTTIDRLVPVPVAGLSGVIAISAGHRHSLALKPDGTVMAWGWNASGELGVGDTLPHLMPQVVTGLNGVIAIEAGENCSYALKSDGSVVAWGSNANGRLGDGTVIRQLVPKSIPALKNIVSLSAGEGHAMALRVDGKVLTWGRNFMGQLGDATQDDKSSPLIVYGLSDVVEIAAGYYNSFAMKVDGNVVAWGDNRFSALTTGGGKFNNPIPVKNLKGIAVRQLGLLGNDRDSSVVTMALKTDGTLVGWGGNSHSQLGDGTTTPRSTAPLSTASGLNMIGEISGNLAHFVTLGTYYQNIDFPATTVEIGTPDFLPAWASSGMDVSYASDNPLVATVVDGKIHVVGVGTAKITASQAGGGIYLPAATVEQTLTVTKVQVKVTAQAKTKVYGEADPALTYTATGLLNGDGVTGTLARVPGEAVGTYAITVGTLAVGENYQLVFAGANLEISAKIVAVTAQPKTKVYGDLDPALTWVAVGLVGSDTLGGALSRSAGDSVGTYPIGIGTLAGSNYTVSFVGSALSVSRRPVTVRADSLVKKYGASDPPLTWKVEGLLGADVLSGALSRTAGESIGRYAIGQGSLAANANYTIASFVGAVLSIAPKSVTVTVRSTLKVYGDLDPVLSYATEGLVGTDSLSGTLSRSPGESVGVYSIGLGSLSHPEYALTFVSGTLSITPRPATVTVHSVSKVYGDLDPTLTYSAEGLVGTDALAGAPGRAAGESVGTYAIGPGSLAHPNYALTFVSGTLSITPRPATVTVHSASKVYGDLDPALTFSAEGLVGTDALAGTPVRAAGESVGTYAIGPGSLAHPNYTLTLGAGSLSITPRPVSVRADSVGKRYGSPDPKLPYVASGLVGSDTLGGALARSAGDSVGTYPIGVGTLSGPNYTVDFVGSVLSVSPKPVTVRADALGKVYGSPDPKLTHVASGLVGSDTLGGALSRSVGDSVGAYPIELGTLTAGANYQLTFTGASLVISPKPALVRADPKAMDHADPEPALTWTAEGLLAGDTLAGALVREQGDSAGSYPITQGSLHHPNYALSFQGSNLLIRPVGPVLRAAQLHYTQNTGKDTVFLELGGSAVRNDTGTQWLVLQGTAGQEVLVPLEMLATGDRVHWLAIVDSALLKRGDLLRLASRHSGLLDSMGKSPQPKADWVKLGSVSRNLITRTEAIFLEHRSEWGIPTEAPLRMLVQGPQERRETWIDLARRPVNDPDRMLGARIVVTHDTAAWEAGLEAYVYDHMGVGVARLEIGSFKDALESAGIRPGQSVLLWLAWNGRSERGDLAASGVYLMRLVVAPKVTTAGRLENHLVKMGFKRSLLDQAR